MNRLPRTSPLTGVCVAALLGLFIPCDARAQAWPDAPIGARVRVQLPDAQSGPTGRRRSQGISGTLTGVTNDTLQIALAPGTATLRVPRAAILDLAISEGVSRRRSAVREGIQGALTFATMGLLLSTARNSDSDEAIRSVLIAGGLGLAGGVAIGFQRPDEHWRSLGR